MLCGIKKNISPLLLLVFGVSGILNTGCGDKNDRTDVGNANQSISSDSIIEQESLSLLAAGTISFDVDSRSSTGTNFSPLPSNFSFDTYNKTSNGQWCPWDKKLPSGQRVTDCGPGMGHNWVNCSNANTDCSVKNGKINCRIHDNPVTDNTGSCTVMFTPSSLSCSVIANTRGFVNGMIPGRGSTILLNITSQPSGATVTSPTSVTVGQNLTSTVKTINFTGAVRDSKTGKTASCKSSATQDKLSCAILSSGGLFGCSVGETKVVVRNQSNCPNEPYQSFTIFEQTCMPGTVSNTWRDTNSKNIFCGERAYLPPQGVVVQTLQPAGDPLATAWINGFDGEVPAWLKTLLGPSMICPHDTLPPPFILLKDRFCPWGKKLAESCTNLVRRGMSSSQRGVATCGECVNMLDRCSEYDFQSRDNIRQACMGLR